MNRKMRVAMIGHKRIPSREGGVEIVVEELGSRMAQAGIEVVAYNRSGHHVAGRENEDLQSTKQKYYKGIRLITVPTSQKKSLNAVIYSFFAAIRAAFGRYDVIHFHAEGPAFMQFIPKLFGKKVVTTIHGLDWQRAKWGGFGSAFLKAGEKMAARKSDAIIVLSQNMQQYFKDTYNRDTICLPNGVDKPETHKPEIITQKYGLEGEDYILFLARLVPEKGLDYLLDAYDNLVSRDDRTKNWRLVIAGGSSHTDEYMEAITEKVAALNRKYQYRNEYRMKNNTMDLQNPSYKKQIIMTGFVQGQELEELYSNASLYVLPSDIEGMPLSLLEALSYGNVCLVSDIPENMEVIDDHAYHFKKSDVEDLTNQLSKIFNSDKPERREIQEFILNKYNWDDITKETLEVYEGVRKK